ncbi:MULTISPECIES: SDR family NAD(P)-dependent oxidoreductase [unclassified Roseateles]|uniref:SDR family NAD(P)-dependent oxidoreductase n=1 Tax=unclassified Roseateles TaxID=2626991 RepID=UPI0006FE92C5|nr:MULTISPECIES: SDR family NAD(P)-dependent oxidoreductase [unclassified Roseateles]KQW44978.1 3-oxoacyl-ACP reductase [Pelomonas sp. Root405]KRA70338.1 3-oxoacyl-ACP reductase [Pelomonas sp. Root662]
MIKLPRIPSLRLDGRRALVTGAGRGLGLACAAALAEAGAEVWLAARGSAEVEAAAQALRARGDRAHALVLDVTDVAATARAVAEHGPFQVLVNNAGTNRPKPFEQVREDDVDALLALNTKAAFFVARAVAMGLKKAGLPGSIIQMSSQMGHVGGVDRSIYCMTKHALEGMSKAMALELGPFGVRVNTVCPTFIETPMTHDWLATPAFRELVLAKIPMGRVGRVEDVMGAVLFLAGDAAALVTGSALMVDGGWTAS